MYVYFEVRVGGEGLLQNPALERGLVREGVLIELLCMTNVVMTNSVHKTTELITLPTFTRSRSRTLLLTFSAKSDVLEIMVCKCCASLITS